MTYRPQAAEEGFARLRECLAEHSLLPVSEAVQRRRVIEQLVEDMSEEDERRFQLTVREVYQDPIGGTVGAISALSADYLLLRLRHLTLHLLMPSGHALISDIADKHGSGDDAKLPMKACEVRERGRTEGFLHGTWRGGERSYFKFLFAQRRAWFIAALFAIGLFLEVTLTFVATTTQVGQLFLRLGAPMLVSSLVLLLERLAQWRDQREPRLYWDTTRPQEVGDDAFRIAPSN